MLIFARGTHIGEFLLFHGVYHQVIVAAVNANNHAFIERIARLDKHAATLLQFPQGIRHCIAIVLRDQHPIATLGELAFVGAVIVKNVAHQARTPRECQELTLKAN